VDRPGPTAKLNTEKNKMRMDRHSPTDNNKSIGHGINYYRIKKYKMVTLEI
jgi:hypothetical protein